MNTIEAANTDQPRGIFINMPILNEHEVISELLESIDNVLAGVKIPYTLCIVDDGSTDGTIEKIKAFQPSGGSINLILRQKKKRGCHRGGALRLANKWGLKNTDHDVFVEMDGDLSHRPEELLMGITLLKVFDVVIASKYLPGGGTVERELFRRFVSHICTFLVRQLIRVPLSDFSNGYRFYTRRAADILASYKTKYTTPSYLTEAILIWLANGLKIGEFPSIYIGRPHGRSKVIFMDHLLGSLRVFEIAYRYHTKGLEKSSEVE